ncbi:voltage-dependent T-type calcium channel subunit alpha-1G-like isoform X2 [Centruroides vittatus]|uniref:voltage-dependent T-type calcium channel subunit alpha-1G-like isoform X2 n=1 Tax=Centruroides vittatus TaxID=120091 RepID=UPI00350F610D
MTDTDSVANSQRCSHEDSCCSSDEYLAYPGFVPVSLYCLDQHTRPRSWCLKLITNPWFERMSMMVILLNCVTLGMYQPCADELCETNRCKTLQVFDDFIFAFFAIEMIIKMIAMGILGKGAYLAETWNRLDLFIVIAGSLEYCLDVGNINLSAIRTIRVLRPLRAINRIPSMRILVMLLLDTLPMLGNVLLLCFFVFFIFGIIGVQLWAGLLRQRCFLELPENSTYPRDISSYYVDKVKIVNPTSSYYRSQNLERDYICSLDKDNGMHKCKNLPRGRLNGEICTASAIAPSNTSINSNSSCINWNQYYTQCRAGDRNPFQGAISFDNIGLAWVAIFLVISLEGWTDIMYYIQDAHSFWDWTYFVLLIVIGSFFMINLCLVVIATQFSETKKREMARMKLERARYQSNSTITSTSPSEPTSCYTEIIKYIAHLWRRTRKKLHRWYRRRRKQKQHQPPRAISLRQTKKRKPWEPGQSSMKSGIIQPKNSSDGSQNAEEADVTAPCASPETSDVDIYSSPRRPKHIRYRDIPDDAYGTEGPKRVSRHVSLQPTKISSSSGQPTSHLTCAELLALGSAQGAVLAANLATNITMQRFYSSLSRGQKQHSAPQLLFYCPDTDGEETPSEYDWTSDSESDEDSSCQKPKGKCYKWWKAQQTTLKKFIDHGYFHRGMLTAILVNTLSMGIEYHDQPEGLTFAVEISNVIFTVIFALEMLLKVLAEGVFDYISSGFNVLDGAIVILSIVELCQSSGSGLSVLRTFRLLRILKLVRFMPALRRQLVVMLRTIDNVAVFFALLILFIFIFSILGMNLFGCRFCKKIGDGSMQCERKNFDSLLWAIVTVFQILTQEDWNVVLFNGMEKTSHWAALYFVALMTFGNYVLFNLLVAILVEGFSTEDDKKAEDTDDPDSKQNSNCKDEDTKSVQWTEKDDDDPKDNIEKETRMRSQPTAKEAVHFPPIITHTAATPQGSPNATLEPLVRELNNKLSPLMAFNISAPSLESIDKSLSQSPTSFASPQESPCLSRTASKRSNRSINLNIPDNLSPRQETLSPMFCRRSSLEPGFLSRKNSLSQSSSCNSPSSRHRGGSIRSWKSKWKKKGDKENLVDLDSGSSSDGEETVLNNMTSNTSHSCSSSDYLQCNGGLTTLVVNTPNNKRPIPTKQNSIGTPRSLSPQNSIKRDSSSPCHRDSQTGSINVSANFDHCSRQNSLTASSLKDDFKLNNLNETIQVKVDNGINAEKLELKLAWYMEPRGCFKDRKDYSLFIFPPSNRLRKVCVILADNKKFDYGILVFIALNCISLAMERPTIPPDSVEREVLNAANYVFTFVFAVEMFIKVIAKGLWYGENAYFKVGWNIMDGVLVIVSLVDIFLSFVADGSPRIFGILRVFRLLRSLRPLRVINRAPGLKLVVQTLLSSLRPIGNIVLICCTFFIIFGILGVQLFKGTFYFCDGPNVKHVQNKSECLADPRNNWVNRKYNFDNLGKALMTLFVLSSKDGWVNIMYTGLDAVDVDMQPVENHSVWRLFYFISFLLLVAFFVLNMFVGVVVENFHRCREQQEKEEKARRAAKRAKKLEKKRKKLMEPPYYINYSKPRLFTHSIVTSKYFDLAIAAVIGLNVVTMAMEFYMMPKELVYALKIFNYFFTAVFILEAVMKVLALGVVKYLKDKWNQLDVIIVILSIVGITLEEMESDVMPVNPTIMRVMRVLRIARVLKLLKMAKGIRALLDTVMQALPQVGNLGLLFFLLFFIFAALGVELFGRLECTEEFPCEGLGEHAHFRNFGMAFLTLFRVATGDNWNGIMKDTLRDSCDSSSDCVRNCCVSAIIAPLYFVVFVLMAQFVLVNVVVAVLMKHLEESHKHMEDDLEMEAEIEQELAAEQEQKLREVAAAESLLEVMDREETNINQRLHKPIVKMASLPANFTFTFNNGWDNEKDYVSIELPVINIGLEQNETQEDNSVAGDATSMLNINLRQASPDEPIDKVAVADLSPIPLRVVSVYNGIQEAKVAASPCVTKETDSYRSQEEGSSKFPSTQNSGDSSFFEIEVDKESQVSGFQLVESKTKDNKEDQIGCRRIGGNLESYPQSDSKQELIHLCTSNIDNISESEESSGLFSQSINQEFSSENSENQQSMMLCHQKVQDVKLYNQNGDQKEPSSLQNSDKQQITSVYSSLAKKDQDLSADCYRLTKTDGASMCLPLSQDSLTFDKSECSKLSDSIISGSSCDGKEPSSNYSSTVHSSPVCHSTLSLMIDSSEGTSSPENADAQDNNSNSNLVS